MFRHVDCIACDAHLTHLSTRRFNNNTERNLRCSEAHVCRIWSLRRVTKVPVARVRRAGRAARREDALPYGSAGTVPARRRAIGSAGERLVHTEEVTGSIPVSPTCPAIAGDQPPGRQGHRAEPGRSFVRQLSLAMLILLPCRPATPAAQLRSARRASPWCRTAGRHAAHPGRRAEPLTAAGGRWTRRWRILRGWSWARRRGSG